MMEILPFWKRVFINRAAQLFVATNLVITVLIYFNKPRVPGFRYDYFEEPTYYRFFKTINAIPDIITGFVFYPINYFFGNAENIWLMGPIFHLINLFFASIQWALIGFGISLLFTSVFQSRKK